MFRPDDKFMVVGNRTGLGGLTAGRALASAAVMVAKIVSGGQTGVDMAALDFARANHLPYGGWVPGGRRNEAGRIPDVYEGLTETQSADVIERTRLNVASSDATLVFVDGSISRGTDQTVVFAQEIGKPHLVIDVRDESATCADRIKAWLSLHPVSILNIAGPRASEAPQISAKVSAILAQSLLPRDQ